MMLERLLLTRPLSRNVHYDGRFMFRQLDEPEQRDAIRALIQTYLSTFRALGVQTWLMHGSLLGWWWGKKVGDRQCRQPLKSEEAEKYALDYAMGSGCRCPDQRV